MFNLTTICFRAKIKQIMAKIKFSIITLFPEALKPYLDSSMLYKAQARGIIGVNYINLRDFGLGPHKSVDDTPYGGGDGMLMRPEPVFAAIESVKTKDPEAEVIMPTPVGQVWNQHLARQFAGVYACENEENLAEMTRKRSLAQIEAPTGLSKAEALSDQPSSINALESELEGSPSNFSRHYIIFCPHYEGYDERILSIVDHPISLGNYVLTGGELPALIIIDSITRLLPGVLGGASSAEIESFSLGDNLEYPQYTKPAEFREQKVPEVLLSGNHAKIAEWRSAHTKNLNS